jgi:hypothetical protein
MINKSNLNPTSSSIQFVSSETKLCEKPFAFASLVVCFHLLLDVRQSTTLLLRIFDGLFVDQGLVEFGIKSAASRQNMLETCHLQEGSNSDPLCHLLLSHSFGNLQWIPAEYQDKFTKLNRKNKLVNSGDQCMSIWPIAAAIIVAFDHHSFSSSKSTIEHNHNAARFHYLSHFI